MEILKQSWTKVAFGYRQIFVQRFSPWVRDSVTSLVNANPPKHGTVFIAGCGTGEEVISVSTSLPENRVEACDLADGMVSLARDLIKANALDSRVKLFVGDAISVPTRLKPLSVVFSCFVLQQMPRPAEVLAGWTGALAPNGILCVCYWPKEVESEGPWKRMVEIDPPKSQDEDWETDIPALAVAQGAEVLSDHRVSHTIEWESVEAFWDGAYSFSPFPHLSLMTFVCSTAMTLSGPWNARLLRLGEERMNHLRFLPSSHIPCDLCVLPSFL
jgi:trans-aconitate methyltransferase